MRNDRAGLIEVVAGEAKVKVPPLRAPVGPLDPRGNDVRVAGRDDAPDLQPVETCPHRALGQARITDQGGHGRERARAVWPGVVGQPYEYEFSELGISDITG
jgi:hypothetical protein